MSTPERFYEVTVSAFELSEDEAEALFDRIADAAHDLNQQVICTGGWRGGDE